MANPKVYIVILNYRKWEDARDCLESVLRSDYDNYTLFLIDNYSQNNSLEHLVLWLKGRYASPPGYAFFQRQDMGALVIDELPKICFIQNTSNEGFAGGNNLVLRLLRDEKAYIWLLNPDMVVNDSTILELLRFTNQQAPGCIVGAEVRSYEGNRINRNLLFYGGGRVNYNFGTVEPVNRPKDVRSLDYISGACLFTHASSFKKLGLLPEEYFLYWEETDWCHRAKQQGFRLLVCPSAICYDKISTVIGKSFLAHYYYARNGLMFISRYRRNKLPVVLFFMCVRFGKRVLTGQWGRARGILKGTLDFFKRKQHEAE